MSDYFDGRLLVAPPRMRDYRFANSVIYMWKHDVSGAAGVIVNKPVQSPTWETLCREAAIESRPGVRPALHYGGPVMNNMIGVLHSLDYRIKTTNEVRNDLGFTLDRRAVEDIGMGTAPQHYIITMGMASWEPGQLEQEISADPPRHSRESWLVMDYDRELVFHSPGKEMWEMALNQAIMASASRFTNRLLPSN